MTRSVSVRELRNQGGKVLDEVSRGLTLVVTRDGQPVAELRPTTRKGLTPTELIERRKNIPYMDPALLRSDLDSTIDMSL